MKPSKVISLSAITCALSVILLSVGAYIDVLDLSCLFTSSLVIMLPLAKKSLKTAIFSYVCTVILTLLITMGTGKFAVVILYTVFFGVHPIVNYLEKDKNWNVYVLSALKCLWFIGALFLSYYAFTLFTDLPSYIEDIIVFVIIFGGGVAFFIYDYLIKRFQTLTNVLIKRLKL
ncbi:MAG: hypothetical protein J6R88_02640 [Clostridia bacterium]|nr:hypothetical protein [Clostridia bacterium]